MATPDLHEGKGLVLSSFEPGFRTSVGVVKATLIAASIATAAVAAPDTGLSAGASPTPAHLWRLVAMAAAVPLWADGTMRT